MKSKEIKWQDLLVFDDCGESLGTLGDLSRRQPHMLDSATISDRIDDWPQFFLAAEGEAANWDTPTAAVDWDGFAKRKTS